MSFFSRGDLYFLRDVHLSFVCGAADPLDGEEPKLRRRFLDWAEQNSVGLMCVRAESAITDLLREAEERSAVSSLGVIEAMIADALDSLLIFPESPGSFAELGFFSANDAISKKTLIAQLALHQGESFITLGPVKHVSSISLFRPLPIVLSEPFEGGFQQISDRLIGETKNKRAYRKRYSLRSWKEYSRREQLAILDCLFDIFGVCTEEDLFDFISRRFGAFDRTEVRLLTGLLVALERVGRTDDADIVRSQSLSLRPLFEGPVSDLVDLKAKWADAYRFHLPEVSSEFPEVFA